MEQDPPLTSCRVFMGTSHIPGWGLAWARLHAAAVGHAVLQGVWPGWRSSGHGGVVVKAIPAQHVEHLVSTNSKERCPHAFNISRVHTGVANQKFSFSDNFIGPFFFIEIGAE
eukprot:TRINITY_DN18647_c0_g1_i1.p1 TRINITY_DN18647_c0_g1~~TRINITY_DN18647_c0_g1_i1.p1  ORF type:complete len:113 (+),score=14.42 TRINITY_DN18647_c0_g1_i1:23-361(+)